MDLQIKGMAPLIQVFDMPRSLHFYRDRLGFTLVNRSGETDDCGWALLRLSGVEIMLNTIYETGDRPPSPDPARNVAHGDLCFFFLCADVDAVYRQLRDAGFSAKEPVIRNYGMKQVYISDPDGYELCFQMSV
jgi:glyoxylase I family protein